MSDPAALVRHLSEVTNAHDLDGIVRCFAAEYRNEMPLHPERDFTGNEQVRRNWTQILQGVPDVHTTVLAVAVDGDTVWSEWEHTGTRPDGSAHLMRGVIIFTVAGERFTAARFYLEPVAAGGPGGVDEAVARQVAPRVASS